MVLRVLMRWMRGAEKQQLWFDRAVNAGVSLKGCPERAALICAEDVQAEAEG
jgi:hypothetical protein